MFGGLAFGFLHSVVLFLVWHFRDRGVDADHYAHRYHNPDGTLEEGLDVLRRAIDEVAKRLVVSPGSYKVKVVDKDGIREITL